MSNSPKIIYADADELRHLIDRVYRKDNISARIWLRLACDGKAWYQRWKKSHVLQLITAMRKRDLRVIVAVDPDYTQLDILAQPMFVPEVAQ